LTPNLLFQRRQQLWVGHPAQYLPHNVPVPVVQVRTLGEVEFQGSINPSSPEQGNDHNAERTSTMFALAAMQQHTLPEH
jgi:hypothetical protein